jgi:hypothetical protein
MQFNFIGKNRAIRLSFDRDIWFPLQECKVPTPFRDTVDSPTTLHVDTSEFIESFKFLHPKDYFLNRYRTEKFKGVQYTYEDAKNLRLLTMVLNNDKFDVNSKKFKLHFTREYVWIVDFNSSNEMITMQSSKKHGSPYHMSYLISADDFKNIEFDMVT